jgi:rfaE bifunctional protein nucleotidyltransferase chain/domain
MSHGPIIFTNGVFDLLHAGHLAVLARCSELAANLIPQEGYVVVGINSDASVQRLKGRMRPVILQDQRKLLLEAIRYVDEVVIFDEDTPYELIKTLRPSVIVKGGDYKAEDVVGADLCPVEIVQTVGSLSTTSILQRLIQNA